MIEQRKTFSLIHLYVSAIFLSVSSNSAILCCFVIEQMKMFCLINFVSTFFFSSVSFMLICDRTKEYND